MCHQGSISPCLSVLLYPISTKILWTCLLSAKQPQWERTVSFPQISAYVFGLIPTGLVWAVWPSLNQWTCDQEGVMLWLSGSGSPVPPVLQPWQGVRPNRTTSPESGGKLAPKEKSVVNGRWKSRCCWGRNSKTSMATYSTRRACWKAVRLLSRRKGACVLLLQIFLRTFVSSSLALILS